MRKNIFRTKKHIFGILILTLMTVGVGLSQVTGALQLENLNFFSNSEPKNQIEKKQSDKTEYKRQNAITPNAVEKSSSSVEQIEKANNHLTILDLIAESETIVQGTITSVTDGIENNVPFTEVKMQVSETFLGAAGEELTFRQFGLIKPRKMPNGYINLNVTPEGWATYKENENVMLFLYKKASSGKRW